MKKTLQLLRAGFESSSQETQEFNEFYKVFVSEFKHELKKYYKVKDFAANKGHFYISGFFKLEDNRIFYFSIPDVRTFDARLRSGAFGGLLLRTAESYLDFTGGRNNYLTLAKDMFKDYQLPN